MRYLNTLRLVPVVVFLLVWEYTCRGNTRLTFFFGLPSRIAESFVSKMADGTLPLDFAVTFGETLGGFFLGSMFGTIFGIGLWYSRPAYLIAKPYIIALGSAPIFALAPLIIIWFGTGIWSKILTAALSTVFIALAQAYNGAESASEDYIRLMRTFRASKHTLFRKIIAPSALSWVVAGLRINVGFALLGAFVGEFISSNCGLGHLIQVASGLFDISLVLCGVLLLATIALILNFLISVAEPRLKSLIAEVL